MCRLLNTHCISFIFHHACGNSMLSVWPFRQIWTHVRRHVPAGPLLALKSSQKAYLEVSGLSLSVQVDPPTPHPPHTLIHTPTCLVEMPWSGTSADSLWFRAGFSHFLSSHEPITFVAHSDESFISSRSGSVLCVCVFTCTVFILFLEGERERERERERACVRVCVIRDVLNHL